jgi:predicted DNA-binding transcriptional regulator AlpA
MRSIAGPDTRRVTSEARPTVGPGEFEPFLTAREVAERLRVAPCTVLRYFEDGVLPGRRLRAGRYRPVRFRWSEIEAALMMEGPAR